MPSISSVTLVQTPVHSEVNPFEGLFRDPIYLGFKNHLYNFLRRRDEIQRMLKNESGTVLEVGSGVSPITPKEADVIFSDASPEAMRHLSEVGGAARAVAMSATEIAFKDASVSCLVCSEVLEHIADDRRALKEFTRVLKPDGLLVLTVPIHAYYFAFDDRFVKHERRYELNALVERLADLGFGEFRISKVAGFLEKVTMIAVILAFAVFSRLRRRLARGRAVSKQSSGKLGGFTRVLLRACLPIYIALNRLYAEVIKWEAKATPLALTSIVLIACRKEGRLPQ